MDKKDIYEHLAKIYLDASSKRKKKAKRYPRFKKFFFIGVAFIFGLAIFLFFSLNKNKLNAEIALILQPDVVKINFNFNPAKKEIYSVNLNQLDLTRFKTIGFNVKKANYKDNIHLRIEFMSTFKEKSEIYLKNIADKWQEYKISFSDFKKISDWSNMITLSFGIEEWNVKEKKGIVYIDNIRFLR